jgi:hypothetical protein
VVYHRVPVFTFQACRGLRGPEAAYLLGSAAASATPRHRHAKLSGGRHLGVTFGADARRTRSVCVGDVMVQHQTPQELPSSSRDKGIFHPVS